MNPRKIDNLQTRTVGDEVLVQDTLHGKVHVLNAVAGRILELCDGINSPAVIARSISHVTGAEMATVERDVDAILGEFMSLRLLEPATP